MDRHVISRVAVVAALFLGQLALPARAQTGASIHLEIEGGTHPGTYDVTTDLPCLAFTDGWLVNLDDPDQAPASLFLAEEAGYTQLTVFWPDGGGYEAYEFDLEVNEQEGGATLTATVVGIDTPDGSGATISIRVDCHQLEDERGPGTQPVATPQTSAAPVVGEWTGTITVHANTDYQRSEPGADDNPNSAYYSTWVTDRIIQDDITDTFTVAGNDPDQPGYLTQVDLTGSVAISGSTVDRLVTTWQKRNSSCHWTQENGQEMTGSWSKSGTAGGYLQIMEDGSYNIVISPEDTGPEARLPERHWTTYSNVSANCEGDVDDDRTEQSGPNPEWASQAFSESDVNCERPSIAGKLDPAQPGSVVEGSMTWQLGTCVTNTGVLDPAPPIITTLTVDWHLEHDGPIVLP